jgi:hypothetical protein
MERRRLAGTRLSGDSKSPVGLNLARRADLLVVVVETRVLSPR